MNITEFEQRVLDQQPVGSSHYDAEYFTGDWRDAGNNYNLETRRQIEAQNPSPLKEVFQPTKALDLGCGSGALMQFDVDPSHITLLNKDMLRLMFLLEGCRSRPDLEARMDWRHKGRVLGLEKT